MSIHNPTLLRRQREVGEPGLMHAVNNSSSVSGEATAATARALSIDNPPLAMAARIRGKCSRAWASVSSVLARATPCPQWLDSQSYQPSDSLRTADLVVARILRGAVDADLKMHVWTG